MRQEFGRVDGVINNAGTTSRVRLPDVDLAEWNRTLGIHLTGPMLGIATLLPLMGAGASIVNVGSIAGLTAHYTAAYTASKWGLRGSPTPPRWIWARAVSASTPYTPATSTADDGHRTAGVPGGQRGDHPLGRGGTPEEVAELMVFLMSDDSRFVTGAEIPIDGGQTGGGIAKFLSDAIRVDQPPGGQAT